MGSLANEATNRSPEADPQREPSLVASRYLLLTRMSNYPHLTHPNLAIPSEAGTKKVRLLGYIYSCQTDGVNLALTASIEAVFLD